MRLTPCSITHLASAAILTFIFTSSIVAQTAESTLSEKKVSASSSKWEYCILTFHEEEGKESREYIVIRYLKANGVQKEKFEHPRNSNSEYGRYDYSATVDLLMTIIAKLGEDGWELAGEDRMIIGDKEHPKFIFKRPKQ